MAKKKGECCPIMFESVPKEYKFGNIKEIGIKVEDPLFMPKSGEIRAFSDLILMSRNSEKMYCGIKIKSGYEITIKGHNDLTAKGIIVSEYITTEEDGYLKINVILSNTGRAIVNIKRFDCVGVMSVQPKWNCNFVEI